MDPSNGSYKGNLDAVQEQLKASEQSQGGGAVPGIGDAPGSGIPVMPPGLGGKLITYKIITELLLSKYKYCK